jgi:hypothetical protein
LTQKIESNYRGWNWKIISIKNRIRTTRNNNKKNKDHIWFKNKMSSDDIQKQINSINDLKKNITVKRINIKSNKKNKL